MRWLALFAFLLTSAALPSPRPALADHEHEPATIEELIAVTRGYDVATVRRTFPAYNTGLFERVFGAGTPIPLATERERAIFAEQLVRTPAGVVLDIGHVVTGLEAAAPLPPTARQLEMLSGCSMRASVTCSGDVGQGLIDYVLTPDAIDPATFYERNASDEDLYGDIDGYVLGAEFGGPAIDVADVLTRAYLESDHESSRFRRFMALLGDDPEAFAARQIVCYARSFAQLTGAPVDTARLADATPYFVGLFIAFLQEGMHLETGGH